MVLYNYMLYDVESQERLNVNCMPASIELLNLTTARLHSSIICFASFTHACGNAVQHEC